MKELVDLIANIGFPIAISIYLLVRVEKKLEGLTNSIRTFVIVMSLIAQASAIKKLVQKIVNEYHS